MLCTRARTASVAHTSSCSGERAGAPSSPSPMQALLLNGDMGNRTEAHTRRSGGEQSPGSACFWRGPPSAWLLWEEARIIHHHRGLVTTRVLLMATLLNEVLAGLQLPGESVGEAANNRGRKQGLELWGKEEGGGGCVGGDRSRDIARRDQDEAVSGGTRLKSRIPSTATEDSRKSQLPGRDWPVVESPRIQKQKATRRRSSDGTPALCAHSV